MKKLSTAILAIVALAFVACATNNAIIQTTAEMVAEEIGIAVAQNNQDPGFIAKVDAYQTQIHALADSDGDVNALLKTGINYLVATYVGNDLTSKRIASKIIRLLELSGLTAQLELPPDSELMILTKAYVLGIVDAFVGGVHMV